MIFMPNFSAAIRLMASVAEGQMKLGSGRDPDPASTNDTCFILAGGLIHGKAWQAGAGFALGASAAAGSCLFTVSTGLVAWNHHGQVSQQGFT